MEIALVVKSLAAIIVAYLLGSVSWAYVIGMLVRGVDMTEVGNGRIGTSFAIQRLGLGWGLAVAVLDFLKGTAAVAIALFLGVSVFGVFLSGLAAVVGHNWSVFLGFKGGRGAATSFGTLAAVSPLPMVLAAVVIAAPFLFTRGKPLIAGLRRTTLLYAVFLLVLAIVLGLDSVRRFLPPTPWWPVAAPLLAGFPLCLLLLNIAGRPQARKV